MKWVTRMVRSLAAFKQEYMASDSVHEDTFESLAARQMRYTAYWAWYENTAYSDVHLWATSYRHQEALYKYVRNLYSPAYRIGSFYEANLLGGGLNTDALSEGAIPIDTNNDALRVAVATLWQDSNMWRLKDEIALRGAVEGDVFIEVVDDPTKGLVYLDRIDPGIIVDCTFDARGNIKGYTIEYQRQRPDTKSGSAKYTEIVSRSGDYVVYETYLNDKPYGWDGLPSRWQQPYTFVPMVHIKHHDVGLEYGWSELHPMRSKMHEVDDMASIMNDYIRKHMNPTWLAKGIDKQTITIAGASANTTLNSNTRPQPGREELSILWGANEKATIEPIIADLNLKDSLEHLKELLAELERDYPELQQDIWSVGATSGRALRIARQRIEGKAQQRREGYDAGIVRAQQMAISIGGLQGYPGYKGFTIESYDSGDLDHSIAPRSIFPVDPGDAAEEASSFWEAAGKAVKAGMPLEGYLKEMGWSEDRISESNITEPQEVENGRN